MPRLLITNIHLREFGGSEMVTLELAEEFLMRGWHVDVFTNVLGDPFRREFEPLLADGLRLSDDPEEFRERAYDLIWVHHSLLPVPLLEELEVRAKVPPIVWNHMSGHVSLEMPVLADVEARLAWKITAVSPETASSLSSLGIPSPRIHLLQNPVPRSFTQARIPPSNNETLRKVLFISNHPPQEIEEVKDRLAASGVITESIGGGVPRRVSPEQFEGMDAVVTIGKSVQYALCLGIPVYEYDHHGGSGWITSDNLEAELQTNFSGRTTNRKMSAKAISAELTEEFAGARAFALGSVNTHRKRFGIEPMLETLLADYSDSSGRPLSISDSRRLANYSRTLWNLYSTGTRTEGDKSLKNAFASLSNQFIQLSEEYQVVAAQLEASQAEAEALRNSRVMRLSRYMRQPIVTLREHRRRSTVT